MNKEKFTTAQDIIGQLKLMDVDGETMQYILERVGMDNQMHRQLIMSKPILNTIDLVEEAIVNDLKKDKKS
jgi:hypothetical protein